LPWGLQSELRLGNLEARRDWGDARDFVRAMWAMLQQDEPRDYVIGTGVTHSVRELVQLAFGHAGLDWRAHVRVDEDLLRPAEVDHLVADASRARAELGWTPRVTFEELVATMVAHDLELARREARAAHVPQA
jgi:GDPmannose 4,6-dehydratase